MGAVTNAASAEPEQKASSSRWNSLRALFALRDSGLGEVAWKIGVALVMYSDASGAASVSCQRLAEAARTSKSGVHLGLAELQKAGPFEVEVHRRAYSGVPLPNRYVLRLRDAGAAPVVQPEAATSDPPSGVYAKSSEYPPARTATPATFHVEPVAARSSVQLDLFAYRPPVDVVQPEGWSSTVPTPVQQRTGGSPAEGHIEDQEKISLKKTHMRNRTKKVPRVSPNQLRLPIEDLIPSEREALHARERLGEDMDRVLDIFKAHAAEPRMVTQGEFDRRFRAYVQAVGRPLAQPAAGTTRPQATQATYTPPTYRAPRPTFGSTLNHVPMVTKPGESPFLSPKWDTPEDRKALNHPNHHLACPGPKCACHEIRARAGQRLIDAERAEAALRAANG